MIAMRLCTLCLLSVALLVADPSFAQADGHDDAATDDPAGRLGKTMVFIQVDAANGDGDGPGEPFYGTGFVIGAEGGYVLTAGHVVAGPEIDAQCATARATKKICPRIRGIAGRRYGDLVPLHVVGEPRPYGIDLALLRFAETPEGLVVPQYDNPFKVRAGQAVSALHFADGETLALNKGFVSNINGPDGNWKVDVQLRPGSSGAPLFNEYFKVIGVVISGRSAADDIVLPINLASPLILLAGGNLRGFAHQIGWPEGSLNNLTFGSQNVLAKRIAGTNPDLYATSPERIIDYRIDPTVFATFNSTALTIEASPGFRIEDINWADTDPACQRSPIVRLSDDGIATVEFPGDANQENTSSACKAASGTRVILHEVRDKSYQVYLDVPDAERIEHRN